MTLVVAHKGNASAFNIFFNPFFCSVQILDRSKLNIEIVVSMQITYVVKKQQQLNVFSNPNIFEMKADSMTMQQLMGAYTTAENITKPFVIPRGETIFNINLKWSENVENSALKTLLCQMIAAKTSVTSALSMSVNNMRYILTQIGFSPFTNSYSGSMQII